MLSRPDPFGKFSFKHYCVSVALYLSLLNLLTMPGWLVSDVYGSLYALLSVQMVLLPLALVMGLMTVSTWRIEVASCHWCGAPCEGEPHAPNTGIVHSCLRCWRDRTYGRLRG